VSASAYAVVGCSQCDALWVVDTATRPVVVSCPRCETSYLARKRQVLSQCDTQKAARVARSRRLAARFIPGTITIEGDPHTATPSDTPWYSDAFAEEAEAYLARRFPTTEGPPDSPLFSDAFAEEAEAYLARRFAPAAVESESPAAPELPAPEDDPFPWATDPTGPEKTELVVTTALYGDSPTGWAPLSHVLDRAFGESEPRHYQRVAWIEENHPELFEKRKASVDSEVRVTREALYLIRSMQNLEKLPWSGPSDVAADDFDALPVQRFRAGIGAMRRVLTDGGLGYALSLHADHRRTLVDRAGEPKALDVGPGAMTPATARRFASVGRATGVMEGLDATFDRVEADHDRAVVLTMTLPRGVADSPVHSFEVFADAWRRFRDRLRYSTGTRERPGPDGETPPYVWVREPQRDGWAHGHIQFPGLTNLDPDVIRADWAECLDIPACAEVTPWVRVDELRLEDGWHVVDRQEGGQGPSADAPGTVEADEGDQPLVADGSGLPGLRAYYSKGPRRLTELAALSPDEVAERGAALLAGEGTDRDRDLARLTFMWAVEARFWDASPPLRP